ncbi:alfa-L-rhamnosidase [Liquorilactobacillus sucicola DSM 21376 = JCM 15457]|uniref:Alpha-L-rhamnosidase n=2 Tax=Liquorilactobacillus sucicola TaxID=519050 RepID=A0A023CX22_9LACO|nr:family 78 glycoside hydrolase catalytic domain [Liquorilactobacillus sucicola]AJA34332.1 alpha-rhamnosidase [Liquorilactobacillus sucicola]KRN06886.1 alpha-L-rhamnosidase [Liquorilactobacillus sucicola DSM 21376 = JCM 15457]GAJ26364.1 alfa-L-rhamnosidase [Liquorilactobacillus sucicola DSM 21376 = JCM 15457]
MEFQMNSAIKFRNNTKLLKKARQTKPKLLFKQIVPQKVVKVVADQRELFGYRAVSQPQKVTELDRLSLGKGDRIVLDLGDHQVGHFQVKVNSIGSPMDAPLWLHVVFAELPAELGTIHEEYHGLLSSSWLAEEYLHLDVLPSLLKLPRRYACRYIMLEVVDTSPKWKVTFSEPLFTAESAVSSKQIAELNSGDPLLDKIDQVSCKTLHDCMQNVFEDGPKRDQRLWLGDLRLQALANYATFDNQKLVKRCLYLFGGLTTEDGRISANIFTQNNPIPDDTFLYDYSLFFISTLADYFTHYHDTEVLQDLFPIAQQQIEQALQLVNQQGQVVLDSEWPIFIDWSQEFDKSTCAQAVTIYALRQFIELAQKMKISIEPYQVVLDKLTKFATEKLYNQQCGLFVSGSRREINIASQVWMALAKVLPPNQNHELMEKVLNKMFPVTGIATPYMYHHICTALFETQHSAEAIELIKNYWGKMLEYGADTFWEAFQPEKPNFSPYNSMAINSYCHAWSCTPAYLLRKYLPAEKNK